MLSALGAYCTFALGIPGFPRVVRLCRQSRKTNGGNLLHRLSTMAAVHPASTGDSPSSRAAEYLAQDRFHRRFIQPATADHGELQVSYADVGCAPKQGDDGTQHPTILFIPGMFASRYLSVWMNAIAEKLGVRVLVVDRYAARGLSRCPPGPQCSYSIQMD